MTNYLPEIRFADIDAMGHVNNAVYLSYFEQARIHMFSQIIDIQWDWNKDGLLVARNEIDYKLPVYLNDRIEIATQCTHVGNKSFTIGYRVMRGDTICATGASVLVCFNYAEQRTQPVPAIWREKLLKIMT